MTTIALKDGIVAYDSRMTRGEIIIDEHHNKKCEVDGKIFFCYGTVNGADRLIDAYINNNLRAPIEANALLIEDGKAYHIGFDTETEPPYIWKTPINTPVAFGSGEFFAFTAMDLGCSAKKAVLMAAKRDIYTNTNVQTYEIKKGKSNEKT